MTLFNLVGYMRLFRKYFLLGSLSKPRRQRQQKTSPNKRFTEQNWGGHERAFLNLYTFRSRPLLNNSMK